MKIYLATLLMTLYCRAIYAADNLPQFAKNSFEVNFSTDMDYYMFASHNYAAKSNRQLERQNYFPFVGFNLGGNYVHCFSKNIGASVGINNQLFGLYQHSNVFTASQLGPPYSTQPYYLSTYNGYSYMGIMSFPVLFHLSFPDKGNKFEFSTGPEFFLPYYQVHRIRVAEENGFNSNLVSNGSGFLTWAEFKRSVSFGWNFQAGAILSLCHSNALFIGPELKLLDAAYFNNPKLSTAYKLINFSLGIKLGFRFGL